VEDVLGRAVEDRDVAAADTDQQVEGLEPHQDRHCDPKAEKRQGMRLEAERAPLLGMQPGGAESPQLSQQDRRSEDAEIGGQLEAGAKTLHGDR
jgi:hypothetical protein